ncbi:MAG: acetylglutamate kinase [Aquificaceae bacterium]|nr:acetylglutamate kinase [Aquificaceae bacterium]MDW8237194.1 acetylglutamate kinase [Aquificaceae bacterium]
MNQRVSVLLSALPYIREFHKKTFVIKFGGSAMVDESLRESFALDVALMSLVGIKPVIVHGGGPQISEALERFGIKSSFVGGLRKTDSQTIKVVKMVLCGQINKEIVSAINAQGAKAVGLSGIDASLIKARALNKEAYFGSLNMQVPSEELGFVGEVESVNTKLLETLLNECFVPVIAPIGIGACGEVYNINADMVASAIAISLKAHKLIYLTDSNGVKDENSNTISSLDAFGAKTLIEKGQIRGGMLPKLHSALEALNSGVKKVHIIDGRIKHSILLEVFTSEGIGTEVLP